MLPPLPGQQASAPVPAMHDTVQHMSLAFALHVPGAPPVMGGVPAHKVAVLATHWPVAVLQTSPVVHCASVVHLPQTLGPPAPQIDPAVPVQSAFVQQLPGVHASEQQMSALFAVQAMELVVQAFETHAPVVVLQIVAGP